jgi:hypothetical protein
VPLDAGRIARTLSRHLLALAAGIACGALLVTAFMYTSYGADSGLVYEGLFAVSLYYGAAIAAVCVPAWLILARLGWDRAPAAAALGFIATGAFLLLTYAAGSHERLDLMAYTVLPYAFCGAVAALVTWWVGRRLAKA